MNNLADKRRYLVRNVLSVNGIAALSLIEIAGDRVEVTPFTRETHSTVYVPSAVALLRPDAITDFLLDDIEQILAAGNTADSLKKIDTLLRTGGLYAPTSLPDDALKQQTVALLALAPGNISLLR